VARAAYGAGTLPATEDPPADRISVSAFPRASRALLDQYVGAFHKVARSAGRLLG
jgi:hypothetical protein